MATTIKLLFGNVFKAWDWACRRICASSSKDGCKSTCQSGTCDLYIMCLFIAFNVSGLSSSKCYTKEISLANFHSARKTGVRPSTFMLPMATCRILTARLDSGKIKAIFKRQRYVKINIHNVRIYCKICIEIWKKSLLIINMTILIIGKKRCRYHF